MCRAAIGGAYENANDPLGNINDNTIEEIWNGAGYQKLRAQMAKGDLEAAGCAKCYAIGQGMALGFEYDKDCEQEIDVKSDTKTPYARNIETLKREIQTGASHLEARPTVVSFTPSHKCNIRCLHCYQESTRSSQIDRVRAEEEVEELAPYLVQLIAGGGEPFLLPLWNRFLAQFDTAKNPYLDFATTTNATIVSPKVLAGLGRFKKLTMNISLDGCYEVYEEVRVGAKFDAVRKNINKLREVVAAAPDKSSTIGISACIMKATICDLPNFVRFATEEGLAFGLSPVLSSPPDQSLRCFNDDPAKEMAGWADALDEAGGLIATLYLPEMVKRRGQQQVTQSELDFWRDNLALIKDAIPFDLAGEPHYRVTVALPPGCLKELHPELRGKTDCCAYVFPMEQRGPMERRGQGAAYWAKIDSDGKFAVTLRAGSYGVNVSTKWETAPYWDHVRFEVPAQPGDATSNSTWPASIIQAHYHYKRPGHVLAKVRRVRAKAQRLMDGAGS